MDQMNETNEEWRDLQHMDKEQEGTNVYDHLHLDPRFFFLGAPSSYRKEHCAEELIKVRERSIRTGTRAVSFLELKRTFEYSRMNRESRTLNVNIKGPAGPFYRADLKLYDTGNVLLTILALDYIEFFKRRTRRDAKRSIVNHRKTGYKNFIQNWREAFSMFDKNGDDLISAGELGTVMRNLGLNPTEEDVKKMISDVDKDGKRRILYFFLFPEVTGMRFEGRCFIYFFHGQNKQTSILLLSILTSEFINAPI
uniref:Calmodulin-like protein 3 n=1 Tax=Magallana gigas TaxID=29159 RepID=K1QA19_MAGGI